LDSNHFFYFKADRKYIHSSNVFDYILSETSSNSHKNIDFSLSRTTLNKWHLITKLSQAKKSNIIGQYKDDVSFYYIIEDNEIVRERRSYHESSIVDRLTITAKEVEIPNGISDFRFIEKVNAAFKALLQRSVFQDGQYVYLFVRITLKFIPLDGFAIQYKRMISHKFCEGVILENSKKIGYIYFIRKENI
jgi:hypothetical protein